MKKRTIVALRCLFQRHLVAETSLFFNEDVTIVTLAACDFQDLPTIAFHLLVILFI